MRSRRSRLLDENQNSSSSASGYICPRMDCRILVYSAAILWRIKGAVVECREPFQMRGDFEVMTDQELRNAVASLIAAQKETDKQVKQVNKQLGELGNK